MDDHFYHQPCICSHSHSYSPHMSLKRLYALEIFLLFVHLYMVVYITLMSPKRSIYSQVTFHLVAENPSGDTKA